MRYYAPRQHLKTGLWHYTMQVGDEIKPVGFCAEDCPGHETPQGAADHFKDYLLDKTSRRMTKPELRMCMICDAATGRRVLIGKGRPIELILCQNHQDRQSIEKLVNFQQIADSYDMIQRKQDMVPGHA